LLARAAGEPGHRAGTPGVVGNHAARVRCPAGTGLHRRAGSVIGWRGRVPRPTAPLPGDPARRPGAVDLNAKTRVLRTGARPYARRHARAVAPGARSTATAAST